LGGGASGAVLRDCARLNAELAPCPPVEPPRGAAAALVTSTATAQDVSAWQHTGTVGAVGFSECCLWCGEGAPCPGMQRDSPATKPSR